MAQSSRYLARADQVTPGQFQRWSGVVPRNGAICDRWRLAEGVLVTNCISLGDGTLIISCWGRE